MSSCREAPTCESRWHQYGTTCLCFGALLAERDEQLAAAAAELARLAEAVTSAADEGVSLPRSRSVAGVCAAADRVVRAAVERDRAAGVTWQEIGEWLEVHPDTARARYGAAPAPAEVPPPPPVDTAEHAPSPETVTPVADETPESVTEPQEATEGREPRRGGVGDDVDPDTVRVEKAPDYEQTGRWRVLAGPADDPVLLGFVARSSLRRTWQATTALSINVPGKPSRSRQDAVIQLLLDVQDRRKRRQ